MKKNIHFSHQGSNTSWRKISLASWKVTQDSSIVAGLELDLHEAEKFLEEQKKLTGKKFTWTHYVGWVLSRAFIKHPELNVVVRGGKIYQRHEINFCFLVADKGDLGNVVIHRVDEKNLTNIYDELSRGAAQSREGEDQARGVKNLLSGLPFLIRWTAIRLVDFVLFGLNRWHHFLGIPRDAFGSVMITSVGGLGIPLGIGRIYPFARTPLMACIGAAREKPVVRQGQVVAGKVIQIMFTVDHRVIDGFYGAKILGEFEKLFLNPRSIQ